MLWRPAFVGSAVSREGSSLCETDSEYVAKQAALDREFEQRLVPRWRIESRWVFCAIRLKLKT
jgi:hypothetical protein